MRLATAAAPRACRPVFRHPSGASGPGCLDPRETSPPRPCRSRPRPRARRRPARGPDRPGPTTICPRAPRARRPAPRPPRARAPPCAPPPVCRPPARHPPARQPPARVESMEACWPGWPDVIQCHGTAPPTRPTHMGGDNLRPTGVLMFVREFSCDNPTNGETIGVALCCHKLRSSRMTRPSRGDGGNGRIP